MDYHNNDDNENMLYSNNIYNSSCCLSGASRPAAVNCLFTVSNELLTRSMIITPLLLYYQFMYVCMFAILFFKKE